MNEITYLIKETPESSLAPSTMWGHSKKVALHEPGSRASPDTESAGTVILASSLQTVRNKCVIYKPPSPWYSLIAAQMD